MSKVNEIPRIIQSLYKCVHKLEDLFPERKFTLDGHIVGSIGEVFAKDMYGLELLPNSTERHDAKTKSGKYVQIKATQGKRVALRSKPKHLIVLKLNTNGKAEEVYNGPGHLAWKNTGAIQKNGQRSIGLAKLRSLMDSVPTTRQISRG